MGDQPNPTAVRRGDLVVDRVYRGDGRVWPPKWSSVQEFTTNVATGWTGFVPGDLNAAQVTGGRAGLKATGYNVNQNAYSMYGAGAPVGGQYIDLLLGAPTAGVLDTGTNGSPLYVRIRGESVQFGVGNLVEVMIRGSGAVTISTFTPGATLRASGSATFNAGTTLRVQADDNVYKVLNKGTGAVIVQWTDTARIIPVTNTFAGMTQVSNRPIFQSQYCPYSVDRWEYGEL